MIYASLAEATVLMQPQAKKRKIYSKDASHQRCARPRKNRILTGTQTGRWGIRAETLPLPRHATTPTILLLDAADARLTLKPLGSHWVLPGTPVSISRPPNLGGLVKATTGDSAQKSMMVPSVPTVSTPPKPTWPGRSGVSPMVFLPAHHHCCPFTTIFSIYHLGSGSIRYMHLFTALLVLFV